MTALMIDCDPGHDDAVAILVAAGSPKIDLLCVTTVFGNSPVANTARNASQVLTLAGALRVPVAAGAAGPLTGAAVFGEYVHGESGLDGVDLPEPAVAIRDEDAVELMHRTLTEHDTPVTIAALGPITNVARLLTEHPQDADRIEHIIFMGGSTERGNHTPAAEFNTYCDPEALDIVLRSGLPISMVGLNATHQALATPAVVERLRLLPEPFGSTVSAWMGFFGGSYHQVWGFDSPPVHDPCTIVSLIDPAALTFVDSFVAVELAGTWGRGLTAVDLSGRYPEEQPNAKVAITVDADRYWDVVIGSIAELARSGD